MLVGKGGLTCSFPFQLDISGKLYLAPLTTVGDGWGWAAQWFPGALLVQCPCFPDLRGLTMSLSRPVWKPTLSPYLQALRRGCDLR